MLSFLVYDWDGHHASEDDFLGSAYIVLSQVNRVKGRVVTEGKWLEGEGKVK